MGVETAFMTAMSSLAPSLTTAAGFGKALSIGSGLLSIGSGIGSLMQGDRQADLAKAEAEQAGKESARQTQLTADQVSAEANDLRRKQKMAFLKSGVTLEGSPLLVMEGTRQRGLQNVQEVFSAGNAEYGSIYQQGRNAAEKYKLSGRSAFMKGLASGGNSFARIF